MDSLNIKRNVMSLCRASFECNIKCLNMFFMNVRISPNGFPAPPNSNPV